MRFAEHYRRFLSACTLAGALFTATVANAQDAGTKLQITFTDGTQSVIALTEDLRMDFDSQHLLILQNNENPRILHIQDIAHFSYATDTSGISEVTADAEPTIRFSADGVGVSIPGTHLCRVFDLKGVLLTQQEFVDSFDLEFRNLSTGMIILQIDQDKTFKFVVK